MSIRTYGGGVARFVGTGTHYPLGTTGLTGVSVYQNSGRDSGVVQADDGGANKVLELVGTSLDIRPNNATAVTVDADGINLASGKVLKIDGIAVLDGQMSHQSDSTAGDVGTLTADFNALLTKLKAVGLMT